MMEVDEEAVAVLASQQGTDDDGYDEVEEEEEDAEDGAGEDPSASESEEQEEEDAEEEAEAFAAKEAGPYARPLISSTHQLNCQPSQLCY